MYYSGLVLEGGGMKGVYTAGVLDFFLDKGIDFSEIYGVSAGACHMCSYISGQRGRARDVGIDYLDSGRYCGVRSLLATGNFFNERMCFHTIPDYLYPYDHEAFSRYEGKAYGVVTNIRTGKAEYLRLKNMKKDIDIIRASSSLPFLARTVKINGNLYLDGGLSDSIPIQKAVMSGNRKNVVVMTKAVGFRRKPIDKLYLALIKIRYIRYPKVAELIKNRHIAYNECLDYIDRLEKKGQIFVIRPQKANNVSRVDKDKKKLYALYEEGYADAKERYDELIRYLER